MARRHELGPFELDVLLALLAKPRDAYGISILDEMAALTGRRASPGALYTTLERLERKGLVRSYWGEPTAQRGGRRKRLYEIEPSGAQAARRAHAGLPASSTFGLPQGA